MKQSINISIDLSKVDKSKIQNVTLKSGKEAKFLNLSVFISDEKDQYGNNCNVSLSQSKAEYEAKAPKTFVGNGKTTWLEQVGSAPILENKQEEDSLPF